MESFNGRTAISPEWPVMWVRIPSPLLKRMTMNFYVPEIGDEIVLSEDWTFKLHAENRNQDLGIFFGYYLTSYSRLGYKWVDSNVLPKMREIDYDVKYPNRKDYGLDGYNSIFHNKRSNEYQEACKQAEQNCPEYVKYYQDFDQWLKDLEGVGINEMDVTIPKGTILKVDRIYIRKGLSDYSSITFIAHNLGEIVRKVGWMNEKTKKKKTLRFWAKLSDCNKIKFEIK